MIKDSCRTKPNLVGARPVGDVIDDKALRHKVFRGCIVAAAGDTDVTLLSASVVVTGHQLVQYRIWAVASCARQHMVCDSALTFRQTLTDVDRYTKAAHTGFEPQLV